MFPNSGQCLRRRSPAALPRVLHFVESLRRSAILVELDCCGDQGNRRTRTIEPYSLRQRREGKILLCALSVERQQRRSYRIERTQGAAIVNRVFMPRIQIEQASSGRPHRVRRMHRIDEQHRFIGRATKGRMFLLTAAAAVGLARRGHAIE